MKELEFVVDKYFENFSNQVLEKIHSTTFLSLKKQAQKDEFNKIWKSIKNASLNSITSVQLPPVKKKKSAYQNFFAAKRKEINEKNPTFKFGELSKEVSRLWKLLTNDEKKKYETVIEVEKPTKEPKEKILENDDDDDDDENIIEFMNGEDNQRSTFEEGFEEDEVSVDEDDEDEFIFDDDDDTNHNDDL